MLVGLVRVRVRVRIRVRVTVTVRVRARVRVRVQVRAKVRLRARSRVRGTDPNPNATLSPNLGRRGEGWACHRFRWHLYDQKVGVRVRVEVLGFRVLCLGWGR